MASPFDSQHAAIRARIVYYADLYGIDRNIAIWQIWQESRFNPRARSGAGAAGIAQFMPATARRFGVSVYDIESSLNGWGKYMSWLLRQSYINGRIDLALAGYNAGEGRVQQYRGIPPFTETRNYVAGILRNAGQSPTSPAITANLPASPAITANLPASAGGSSTTTNVVLAIAAVALISLLTE